MYIYAVYASICLASLTQTDSRHAGGVPKHSEVGDQEPPAVASIALGVLDGGQRVDQHLARPHLHLPAIESTVRSPT